MCVAGELGRVTMGPAAGMTDSHGAPGFLMVYGERKSNSCSWRAGPLVRGPEGSGLKVPDTPGQWTSFPLTWSL